MQAQQVISSTAGVLLDDACDRHALNETVAESWRASRRRDRPIDRGRQAGGLADRQTDICTDRGRQADGQTAGMILTLVLRALPCGPQLAARAGLTASLPSGIAMTGEAAGVWLCDVSI